MIGPRCARGLLASGIAAWLLMGNARAETAAFTLGRINYSNVVAGLAYAAVRIAQPPLAIHVARVDRHHHELGIEGTLASGKIQQLAPLSRQVAQLDHRLGRPLVAVNGDFFRIRPGPYQGDPDGSQILRGELVSAPGGGTFWIGPGGEPYIGRVRSRMEVAWPNSNRTHLGLNESPLTNAATLFTAAFGPATCATNQLELVLERGSSVAWLPLRVEQTYRPRIREIRITGNSAIGPNEMVLVVNGSASTNALALRPGDTLTLSTPATTDLGPAPTSLGGGPVLLERGAVQPWPSRRGALDYTQPRHPRTAIGFNRRYLFLVVADGRQPGHSVGLSFVELTAVMLQLGCTDALNLDGGGSATFWLNGRVINSPSDGRERPIANGLVVVHRTE